MIREQWGSRAGQGWAVAALGFGALSLAFSARAALGLATPDWQGDLGWSRGFISEGGALALIVMAAVAPLAGNLVDRRGPRALLAGGLLAIAIGMAIVAAMHQPWVFIAGFSLVAGLGFGSVATHVVATAVTATASVRRGLAVGIATSGATAGQLLLVPLLAALLAREGWRLGFLALAAGTAIAAASAFVLLGGIRRAEAPRAAAEVPLRVRLGYLLRSPTFHLLFWSFTICGFTTSGVVETHLLPFAATCGFAPLPSATAYGVLSASNLVGMILAGYLSDRTNRPVLLGAIYLLRAACFALLFIVPGDLPLFFVFAILFGLFDYSTVPVTASLVASHLGLDVMGLAMGLVSAGHALGGAAGAYLGGVLFDLFAQYWWMWTASLSLAALAGLLSLSIGERPRLHVAAAPA